MKKRLLSLALCLALCLGLFPFGALATGGGIYVHPGSHTEGGGGTYTPPEDTRAEIWCVGKPSSIQRGYDGTTDGSTIPIDLTFTDGTDTFTLKERTGFTAKKTFDSADAGRRTVTVEIELIGDAAAKYKLKAGGETFTIGGYIDKAHPDLTVSLSRATCAVGEKLLPLLSVEGAPEDAAVTYYYTTAAFKNLAGSSDVQGSEVMPKIDENTAIDKLDEEDNNTYYVYARTAATQNYQEGMSNVLEFTVAEKVDPVASVTRADGTEITYGSFPDAWTAAIANNGSTLKLLADGTLSGSNTDLGQSLTLDLNGYMLGSNGSLTVKNGAALTVKNAGAEKSEKPVKAGLYLNLLVEKGGSFTCTDGVLRYLGLLSAGTGDYAIQLAEGENHCTFSGFAQGDESATVGDLLKAAPGMALHGDNSGSDVQITRSTLISKGFNYFSFYVGPCSEHQMDANGTCIYCGASYVASVTAGSGESTNYTSLDDALDAMKDGDTVTLLGNAEVTKWHSLSKAFTLELNGKTATTQSNAELYLHARVIVQDSSTGETGGMAGTALLNVQSNGDLIIQSGTFDGKISINDGKLTINGGTFNQEVALPRGDSVFFSGGTFAKIWYPNSSGSFLDLLAAGYAFYDNDGKLVNVAKITGTNLYNVRIRPHQHTFTNGACGCGYTCPHTSVNENGVCEICNKRFAASVTAEGVVTYYDTLGNALSYATKNNGCTLKLLANVTDAVSINTPFIFDLNGHDVNMLSVGARAKIRDSGTTKGILKELKVFNIVDADGDETVLTVADLLEEGYAFKSSSENKWYFGVENAITNVTVQPAPIKSVTAEHPTVTVEYGKTSGVTLTATAVLATEGGTVSYQWYKIGGTDFPIQDATENTYQLPADLGAGTHTYRLTATSDGYPKSVDITVEVTPISLEGAEVTVKDLTYNGKMQLPTVTVTLDGKTLKNTDFDVDATMQTNAGSYTLTVNGNGNYSGKIENVEWKIDPLPISLLSVSSISKTYDGSADVTLTADKLTFFSNTAMNIKLPNTALSFSNAQFTKQQADGSYLPSPEVGGGKALSFTMTLTSNNYVFEGKSKGTTEVSDVFATDDVNRFTITKAAAPTDIQTGTLNVVNGTKLEYTYDAKQLLPKAPKGTYGKVSYNCEFPFNLKNGYYVDDIAIKDSILTLTIDALNGGETGKIGTIPVYVTTDNYASFNLPLDLYAVNKITPVADGEITAAGITYGDALSKSTISGKMKDPNTGATVNGTFAWTDGTTKPAANDSYEAEWTFTPAAGYEKYATATGTVTIKVNKATPTFTAPTAQENLTYTGHEQALITAGSVTSGGTMQYSLTENGTYSQDIPTGTDAGAYTVWYRVFGDANHNDTAPASVEVSIGKKPLTLTGVTAASKPYDGTTNADISSVTFDNVILNRGTDYNVTASFDDASVGNGKNITATVTLIDQAAKNYFLEQSSFLTTGSITKAAAPDFTKETALTIINDCEKTYTVTLPTLPTLETPKEYGTVTYGAPTVNLSSTYYADGAKVEDGKLILPIQKNDMETTGSVGTVTVVIKSTNYADITLTVNVNATNKLVPTGEPTLSAKTLTYGQALSAIKLSGKLHDNVSNKDVEGTFTWTDGAVKPDANDRYEAGWKFTPTNQEKYAEVTGTVTIKVNKAATTGEPKYTEITTSGKTLKNAALTTEGSTFSVPGHVQWVEEKEGQLVKMDVDTEVKANTSYTWKFVPTDTDNYNSLTGTITLWHKSSSGSSSGSVTPGTKTDTVKNPDGSTTKTETKADGSKTESTTASSAGGSTGTTVTKTDSQGNRTTEAEAKLSEKDVKNAQETGEAVQVPVKKIEAAKDSNRAPEIKVELPSGAGKTTVEIPVDNVSSGTVAVIVHPDGTEEIVKDSKPTEGGVQLELSGSTTVKIIDNSKTFDDTKDHWSRDEVNFVAARELFNGVGGNQFGVSEPMTRGMVNTVLARLAGVDTTPSQGQAWYEVGTDWAKKNGISDGTDPTAPVTREQLATLLYRYAGSPSVSGTLHAADAASVSDYAKDALLWANQNGIVNGVGSNTIAPKDNAQRAQVAAMLARYLQNQ